MDYTQIILAIITGVISFLLGRKRGAADTESILLQNLESSINIYQILIQNLKEEITELTQKVNILQQKLDDMEKASRRREKKVL